MLLYHKMLIPTLQIEVQRMGGRYGNCTDIDIRNFTRNVFEEKYGVKYSTNVSIDHRPHEHVMLDWLSALCCRDIY